MKTTFNEFLLNNTKCNKFDGNTDAIMIFDYLSKDESIIKMIVACDSGKPALSPVVHAIEELVETTPNVSISFEDKFTKQTVGTMVKSILEPFGYRPTSQKILPKSSGAQKFTSAHCYEFDPDAPRTMRIVKVIETI